MIITKSGPDFMILWQVACYSLNALPVSSVTAENYQIRADLLVSRAPIMIPDK